jgi:hypothetical protein
MERKRRTITVSETATLLSLKLKGNEIRRGWCNECATEVIWLELTTAIEIFAMASEKSLVHFSAGRVCSRSLTRYLRDLNKEKGP